MHEEHKNTDDDQEWCPLDQASVRMSIREIIRSDMPGDFGEQVVALQHLGGIVKEETAKALAGGLNMFIGHPNHNSRQGAMAMVADVERDLSSLNLALKDPASGKPARLSVAATPPDTDMGWIEIQPLINTTGQLPKRLPKDLPKFDLMPEPPRDQLLARSPGR